MKTSLIFQKNDHILFQGDSITDAGRRNDPLELGWGYFYFASNWLMAQRPDLDLRFTNRGISGNRVKDLEGRWEEDCLALKPNWISILIGINDTWRRYDRNDPTPCEDFAASYRRLLKACRTAGMRIIMCEPFVLPVPADRKQWREDLDPKIAAIRELATEFAEIYVPFDSLFAAAALRQPAAYWAEDGVHPSRPGHAMMAQEWLRCVGACGSE